MSDNRYSVYQSTTLAGMPIPVLEHFPLHAIYIL